MTTKVKVRTVRDVREKRIADIAEMAGRSFAKHTIEVRLRDGLFGHWTCSHNHSCIHLFNITQVPGRLIVTGDIGVLVVERTEDMLAWSRSAIRDVGYFAQKVPQEIPTREYDQEVADAWCNEEIAELRAEKPDKWEKKVKQVREMAELTDDQHNFETVVYFSGLVDGCDFPDFRNWKSSFLWCREAVKWFLEHWQEDVSNEGDRADETQPDRRNVPA